MESTKPVEPSQEDKLLKAVMSDDTLKGLFEGDEVIQDGEVQNQEDVVPATDKPLDTEDVQPVEGDDEIQATHEPEVDISDLLTPEGDVDLDKLKNERKSRLHAQKLIGKTAKDREELNRLKAVEEKLQKLEVERVSQSTKTTEANKEPAKSLEALNAEVIDLYRAGKVAEAHQLLNKHDTERQKLQEEVGRMAAERATEAQNARQRAQYDQEVAFRKAHVSDGLFETDGKVRDKELFQEMVNLVQTKDDRGVPVYAMLTLKDVHSLAKSNLNRSTTLPQRDTTKARLVATSANRNARPVAHAAAKRSTDEIIDGVTAEDIQAVLGYKTK